MGSFPESKAPLGDINTEAWSSGMGFGVGLTTLPCKKKIVEKPPRNSAGFCGGGQGLSWAVEPRREEESSWGVKLTTHPHLVPWSKNA
jgi:hypothetical protein